MREARAAVENTMATKGNFGCRVPKGGRRHGCGGDNEVFELRKEIKRAVKDEVSDMAKRHERNLKAHKKEVAERLAAVSSPGVPSESTSRPRETVPAAVAKGERLYHVVTIVSAPGRFADAAKDVSKAYMTLTPVTHREGMTIIGKLTHRKDSRHQLEEATADTIPKSPAGIIRLSAASPGGPKSSSSTPANKGPTAHVSLKQWLLMMLGRDYPYTNDELLKYAKAHGHNVGMAKIKAAVNEIVADVSAGRLSLGFRGALR